MKRTNYLIAALLMLGLAFIAGSMLVEAFSDEPQIQAREAV